MEVWIAKGMRNVGGGRVTELFIFLFVVMVKDMYACVDASNCTF